MHVEQLKNNKKAFSLQSLLLIIISVLCPSIRKTLNGSLLVDVIELYANHELHCI